MTERRQIYFISDRTGITAETLGHSLLTQFDVALEQTTIPFVDSVERAQRALQQIVAGAREARPIVFSTIVSPEVREVFRNSEHVVVFDFFDTFIGPLEHELKATSSHVIGRSHGRPHDSTYDIRIDAMNFALSHDDGQTLRHLDRADVILTGVSRSGKTPVSLYLALQFGIYTANYPLTEDELHQSRLPRGLAERRNRLYGLTIDPERLHRIRNERRPGSRYADLRQCRYEVARAETLLRREGIAYLDSTNRSIEEIASSIIHERGLPRRVH